jgi:hypothetical protein
VLDYFLAELVEPEQANEIFHNNKLDRAVDTFEIGEQLETLFHYEKLGQIGELRTVAHVASCLRVISLHVHAVDDNLALTWTQLTDEHFDESGLSRSVKTQNSDLKTIFSK